MPAGWPGRHRRMETVVSTLPLSPAVALLALQFLLFAGAWAAAAWLLRRQRAVLLHWAGFMLAIGLGFGLMAQRGEPRTWWAFNGASLCWTLGLLVLWRGLVLHFSFRPWTLLQAALALGMVLGHLWLGPGAERAVQRVVFTYGVLAMVLGGLVLNGLSQGLPRVGRQRAGLLALPGLICVAAFIGLAVRQALNPHEALELHRFDDHNLRALAAYLVAAMLFNLSFAMQVVGGLLQRLRDLSQHDALTGLYNRRAMDSRLQQQWEHFVRSGERFSIALLDLDHFKRINDTRGHQAGDEVLKRTAAWLAIRVRGEDTLARVGGEEFLVLMPGADGEAARALAERLRHGLAEAEAAHTGITVSIGVAEALWADAGTDRLLRRADAAMYRAKEGGRDRVALDGA